MGSGEGVGHKSPKGLPWWSSVRTSPSNAWGADSVPGQKLRSHMPGAKQPKQNRSNTVTNSIKTFKMVHIKKKKKTFQVILVCPLGCSCGMSPPHSTSKGSSYPKPLRPCTCTHTSSPWCMLRGNQDGKKQSIPLSGYWL